MALNFVSLVRIVNICKGEINGEIMGLPVISVLGSVFMPRSSCLNNLVAENPQRDEKRRFADKGKSINHIYRAINGGRKREFPLFRC